MFHKRIVLWGETVLIAAEYSMIQTRNTTDDTKCPQFPFQLSGEIQPRPNGVHESHICETLDKCLVEVNRSWGRTCPQRRDFVKPRCPTSAEHELTMWQLYKHPWTDVSEIACGGNICNYLASGGKWQPGDSLPWKNVPLRPGCLWGLERMLHCGSSLVLKDQERYVERKGRATTVFSFQEVNDMSMKPGHVKPPFYCCMRVHVAVWGCR